GRFDRGTIAIWIVSAALAQIAVLPKPGDRIRNAVTVGTRGIAKLPARLRIIEEHVVARHAQAVERQERLASGDEANALGERRQREQRRDRHTPARRRATDDARDLGQHVAQIDVLAAQDVALAE